MPKILCTISIRELLSFNKCLMSYFRCTCYDICPDNFFPYCSQSRSTFPFLVETNTYYEIPILLLYPEDMY